jgi:tetratricopeptide (TPR) repeat protein
MGPRSNIGRPAEIRRPINFAKELSWLLVVVLGICCLAGAQGADPMMQHLDAAENSLRVGNQNTAATEYRAFLAEAIHRAANARARAGDLSGAARSLQEALAFSGDDVAVRLDYASMLFDQGRWKEAEEAAQPAVTADPKNARARALLGQILFEEKDYPASTLHLQAAVDLGEFNQVWRPLAIAYLRVRQLDRARAVIAKMITILGDTPANRVTAATIYYYGDYADEAAAELKKVQAAHPATRDAHYYLALAYLARNEEAGYANAVPEFRAELALNPDDFRSHYMLGYIALQQRRFSEAQPELMKARALNPSDTGAQLLLGQLYSESDRAAQAEEVLRGMIASWGAGTPADFTLVRAHYILGRVLREAGHLEEGAAEIAKAEQLRRQLRITATETNESRLKSLAGTDSENDGLVRHKSNQANSSDAAKAQAFLAQISPLIGEAYYNLAGIAAQQRDSAASAQYLQMAVAWDPSLAKVQH